MATLLPAPLNRLGVSLLLCGLLTGSPAHSEETYWEYEMQPGDSIWRIAHELLTDWRSWQRIERINQVKNDRLMAQGSVLRIPSTLINQQPAHIELVEVYGPVSHLDPQGNHHTLNTGNTKLQPGAQIKTGQQASALLRFADNTQVLLSQNSQLTIDRSVHIGNRASTTVSDIRVHLSQGEAEVRANPQKRPGSRFVIDTPSAFATTRGTVYRVRAQQQQTAAEVTEGRIQVANEQGAKQVKQQFGSVTRKNQPPQPPIQLLPAPGVNTSVVRYLPARVSWQPVAGATHYRSQLSSDPNFTTIELDQLTPATHINIPADVADGGYWLKVRAADSQGLQGMENQVAVKVDARPFPPVLQAPLRQHTVYSGPVQFQWTMPPGEPDYHFELALDDTFTQPVQPLQALSDTELTVELMPGDYFWRVTSITSAGKVGPPGRAMAITVKPTPATPELKAPEHSDTALSLAWSDDPIATSYQMELAHDAEFTELVAQQSTGQASISLPRPIAGDYYLRVRGIDNDGYPGGWTAPQKLQVPVKSYLPISLWTLLCMALVL